MSDLNEALARHLEVPQALILVVKEYREEGVVNVLLKDMSKHRVTLSGLETAVEPDPLADVFGAVVAKALYEAGFESMAAVEGATDEQLLAVKGFGEKSLALLRG